VRPSKGRWRFAGMAMVGQVARISCIDGEMKKGDFAGEHGLLDSLSLTRSNDLFASCTLVEFPIKVSRMMSLCADRAL